MSSEARWDAERVRPVADDLSRLTGLRVELRPALVRRLGDALRRLGLDPDQARERLWHVDEVREELTEAVVVDESYFLRERGHFEFLSSLLPELARAHPHRSVRVLSAGCARGEEAYSVAITAQEQGIADRVEIVGIDLCRGAIERARLGVYRDWALRGVEPAERRRWFSSEADGYALRAPLRDVTFEQANLLDPGPPGQEPFDVVLCRHVLLHLDPRGAERAVEALLGRLAPGGLLLTAASDPVVSSPELTACRAPVGAFRKRDAGSAEPVGAGIIACHTATAPDPDGDAEPDGDTAGPAAWPAPTPAPSRAVATPTPPGASRATPAPRPAVAAVPTPVSRPPVAVPPVPVSRASVDDILALRRDGRLLEAAQRSDDALGARPEDAGLHTVYAAVLLELGRAPEAVQVARGAAYLDRDSPLAHLQLGLARQATGDARGARIAFRTARRLFAAVRPDTVLPLADGEPVERLAALAATHEDLIGRVGA